MINPARQPQERTSVSIARYGIDNRRGVDHPRQLSAAIKRSRRLWNSDAFLFHHVHAAEY